MEGCNPCEVPMEARLKLSKFSSEPSVDATTYRQGRRARKGEVWRSPYLAPPPASPPPRVQDAGEARENAIAWRERRTTASSAREERNRPSKGPLGLFLCKWEQDHETLIPKIPIFAAPRAEEGAQGGRAQPSVGGVAGLLDEASGSRRAGA